MGNSDFVREFMNGRIVGDKKFQNLFVENDVLYSYGYHYPLAWRTLDKEGNDIMVVNVDGFSSTTAKHIGCCMGYGAVEVVVNTGYGCKKYYGKPSNEDIVKGLEGRVGGLYRDLHSCVRAVSQKKTGIENQIEKYEGILYRFQKTGKEMSSTK